jgi:hypothetical protein
MHNLIDAGGLLEESILECTIWVQEVQENKKLLGDMVLMSWIPPGGPPNLHTVLWHFVSPGSS